MQDFDMMGAVTRGEFEEKLFKLQEKELLVLLCIELNRVQNRLESLLFKEEG